jgi:branched-chain amino acid transport system substrate-binding protein
MDKRILFRIDRGSFATGFDVTLHLLEGGQISRKVTGQLLADLNLFEAYGTFRQAYFRQDKIRSVIPDKLFRIVVPPQITHPKGCLESASELNGLFQAWMDSLTQSVQLELLYALKQLGSIQFILQTQDVEKQDAEILAKLPWHTWHFFERYQVPSEITLGHLPTPHKYKPLGKVVRILAILGHSEGINTHHDLQVLRQIWGAWVTPLEQPSRRQLTEQLWQQKWDILFFAGHSVSEGSTGRIYINETESLTLEEVQASLRQAGKSGLKIAIFNSCDGLGLVSELADSGIPWMIVMREPIPDRVAQLFLSYFLEAFSQGKPFLLAVQNARHQLEGIQGEFPCATWLPIVCQNSAATPLIWPQWAIWPNRIAIWVHHRLKKIKNWANQHKPLINQKFQDVQNWMTTHTKPLRLLFIMMLSLLLTFILWPKPSPATKQMSFGESILVTTNPDKRLGAKEFSERNYERAISAFQRSLDRTPDDPEARIYLSNSGIGSNNSVAIAVGVPISQQPDISQEILRGVAQAQEELNRNGGIRNTFLKVKIVNDKNDPKLAVNLAQQLVEDREIIAVVGHNASDVSIEASKKYQGQLVMISPTSFAKDVTEGAVSETGNYIYRTVLNIDECIKELVHYAKNAGLYKFVLCSDFNSPDNQSYRNEFASQLRSEPQGSLVEPYCNLSGFFNQQLQRVKNARDAQGLFLAPYVGRIDAALDIAKANQGKLRLLGSPTLNTAHTLEKGKEVEGMVLAVPWHSDNSPNQDFVNNADTLWHSRANLTWRSATAYDATLAIIEALEQSDGSRTGLQHFLSQTESFTAHGATGEIRFLPNGDRQGGTPTLIQVQHAPQPRSGYRFTVIDNGLRTSMGTSILIQENITPDKEAGVQAFAKGEYKNAQKSLAKSLRKSPNDPEARIYLNNANAADATNPFKLAIVVPLSGRLSSAQEILRGVAQAQEEFNQDGGIAGRLLEIEIADDRSDADTGKNIAELLVNDVSILAVIGHNASEVSVEAAPIYQKGKLVMITPTTGTNKLRDKSEAFRTLPADANYIFRVVPSVATDAVNLKKFVQAKSLKKLLVCSDSESPYSQDILNEFASVNSGIKCDFDDRSFNRKSIINESIKRKVDGFMLTPSVIRIEQALNFIQDAPRDVEILGGSTIYNPKTLKLGDKVNGLLLSIAWHPDSSSSNRVFAKKAQHLWNGDINWRTAMSYDAAQAILEGLKKSPTKTREGLQSVLSREDFAVEGAAGPIKFSRLGDRKSNPNLGILVEAQCKPIGCRFVPWKPQA